jgi:flagellar P-ring protein precursor FlgI
VSSVGDAKSLQGGTLLQAPLQAANGEVYAVAQGSVSIGGFSAGGSGASVTKNHPTAGRIPNGAIVEKEVPATFVEGNSLNVVLSEPDFTTASRVTQSICAKLGPGTATAKDPATIKVTVPDPSNIVGLISDIGELTVEESSVAKVIVNERTGTVIIGGNVRLSPVAISHGNLSVEVKSDPIISQPEPVSKGKTTVVAKEEVKVKEEKNNLMELKPGATLEDLVSSLNDLKVTPRDIIAILQALKQAGALHAELEII